MLGFIFFFFVCVQYGHSDHLKPVACFKTPLWSGEMPTVPPSVETMAIFIKHPTRGFFKVTF